MVVVENGKDYIGEYKEVNVTKVLQTAAGRMIFGRVEEENGKKKKVIMNVIASSDRREAMHLFAL